MKIFSRRGFNELLVFGTLAGCTTPPAPKQQPVDWTLYSPDRYGAPTDALIPWRLVAMSDLIVSGILTVTPESMAKFGQLTAEVIVLPLSILHVFAGTTAAQSVEIFSPADLTGGPDSAAIASANGRESLLFLVGPSQESGDVRAHYFFTSNGLFAGNHGTAIPPSSTATVNALTKEISEQGPLAARTAQFLADHVPPNDGYVAALIEQLLAERTAYDASQELLSLGPAYAAALVHRMDDRRPIALKYFSVPAPMGYFEAIIHWGPKAVVDVISTVLQVNMDYSMFATSSGGSERARRKVVDAWRSWLGRSLRLQAD